MSDPATYTPLPVADLRPFQRHQHIRQALTHGDWQTASAHLHEAHTRREWRSCAFRSWSDYVWDIPISRTYDWHLRLIHTQGVAPSANSFKQARTLALHKRDAERADATVRAPEAP